MATLKNHADFLCILHFCPMSLVLSNFGWCALILMIPLNNLHSGSFQIH